MITVLHSARANMGDFLIRGRAIQLLMDHTTHKLNLLPSWQPIGKHIDMINAGSALVIAGGPGLRSDMYPRTYPLTLWLSDIKVPIVLLGLGVSMPRPDSDMVLTDASKCLLDKCIIGVRDPLSLEVLEKAGYDAKLIGCPAMHTDMGRPTYSPSSYTISTPANDRHHRDCEQLIMQATSELSSCEGVVSFNAGWKDIAWPASCQAVHTSAMCNMDRHDTDFHIGYRVHSHVSFLARGKPSILLHEDARGAGMSRGLNLDGVNAWEAGAVDKAMDMLREDIETGFTRQNEAYKAIEGHKAAMINFIKEEL